MANVLIVGSVALDSIKTPFASGDEVLGGSATYSSIACSLFAKPGVVAVVGNDFPQEHIELLESKGVDLKGLEKAEGKTFRWKGYYEYDMNVAKTLETQLNVFEHFKPKVPDEYKEAEFLFLGNISPQLQLDVLKQMKKRPKMVIADTMNFWIEQDREKVLEVVNEVDIALMNDGEARQLFKTSSIVKAAREILKLNSDLAIIKKGEHGALFATKDDFFIAPGYPLENVVDPTGAGDCFAGSLIGYLAQKNNLGKANIRKGIIYASSVASFNAEGFATERISKLNMKEVEARFEEFKKIMQF